MTRYITKWEKLNFGRYEGLTLPHVLLKDPDYFYYMYDRGHLAQFPFTYEAREVAFKGRMIKILDDSKIKVEPITRHVSSGYDRFRHIIMKHRSLYGAIDRLDLCVPYLTENYNKGGGRMMIRMLKLSHFGTTSYFLTRKRCDEFIENEDNFIETYEKPEIQIKCEMRKIEMIEREKARLRRSKMVEAI
jgi:hypothetical protein